MSELSNQRRENGRRSRLERARHLVLVLVGLVVMSACSDGSDPTTQVTDPAVQASYDRYLAAIDTARTTVQGSPFIRDDADRAAGESFLRGITTYALAAALNLATEQPLMAALPDPNERLGFNNPDNLYYVTRVSDQDSYTISGRRGPRGLPHPGVREWTARKRQRRGCDHRLDRRQRPAPCRRRLLLDHAERGAPGAGRLDASAARHRQPAGALLLPRLGERGAGLDLDRQGRRRRLASARDHTRDRGGHARRRSFNDRASSTVLRRRASLLYCARAQLLRHVAQGQQGTNVQQWQLVGNYDLTEDQVLLIEIKDVPQAKYASLMAATPWLDTFEFIHHQVSLNRAQVRVDGDGHIRYVVSARDPGVPNWIDTTGQVHGVLFGRWQEVEGELGLEYAPTLSVLDLGDLRAALPSDTPTVTPEERTTQLALRQQLLEARFRDADPAQPEILRRLHEIERLLGQEVSVE